MDDIVSYAVDTALWGGTLLYPTDTIWGIGCDATNRDAIEKVYAIKRRDHSKSMLILCADIAMVERFVGRVGEEAASLLVDSQRPTTVILPAVTGKLPSNLLAADGTVGVRIPRMEFCQRLLSSFGRPIVSTSANFSNTPSPAVYEEIDKRIFDLVDYAVPQCRESTSAPAVSSRIVKMQSDGTILVIRG